MAKVKSILAAKAHTKYLRVSPRKMRLVIDLVRGEKVPAALTILNSLNKGAKRDVQKTLNSALSNARRNPEINTEDLFISKITADCGPMLKRFRAAAMGRATKIRHRTTHLSVELSQTIKKTRKATTKTTTKRKSRS